MGFTLFIRPSGGVRMITWILFIGFHFFLYIYHLGQDLGWDLIWALYLIKYAHNGRLCDLGRRWRGVYLLLISMLWHRQANVESKGDKLSSSAECRIRTQGLWNRISSRLKSLNACWQTDWATENQAKNLNSVAGPYDQRAFSPLDATASWLSHLALAIYRLVVVNFDALAQASEFRIKIHTHTYIHVCCC